MNPKGEPTDVHRLIHCRAERRGESEMLETDLWIVTQSPRRVGSITVAHTRSIGASIWILAETVLIGGAH